ncbi:MAG TPA: PP2C family protein-serine/threonine phosphatase [Spirochaetales bacterium]|nr:PP2C family protein-serine/threonine phosphatase [Spirochaetales bacterium]
MTIYSEYHIIFIMESFFLVAQKYRKQDNTISTLHIPEEFILETEKQIDSEPAITFDTETIQESSSTLPQEAISDKKPQPETNEFTEIDLDTFIENEQQETSPVSSTADKNDPKTQELARAYEELQRRNDEYRRELIVTRRVQETFIPSEKDFPKRSELNFGGFYQAMADIGGDLYDVIRIGRNAYGFLIADVSGHGVPAALITALVKVAFRSQLVWGVSPDLACKNVNHELYEIIGEGERYVTAFLAILNLETGILEFTNAGHHPGILLRNGDLLELNSDGRFLGIFPEPVYSKKTIKLEADDSIILYTDGIIEAKSYLDEEYGHDRFHEALMRNYLKEPQELIDAVMSDLDSFTMGAPAHDDRAMLVVRFNGLDSTIAATVEP